MVSFDFGVTKELIIQFRNIIGVNGVIIHCSQSFPISF